MYERVASYSSSTTLFYAARCVTKTGQQGLNPAGQGNKVGVWQDLGPPLRSQNYRYPHHDTAATASTRAAATRERDSNKHRVKYLLRLSMLIRLQRVVEDGQQLHNLGHSLQKRRAQGEMKGEGGKGGKGGGKEGYTPVFMQNHGQSATNKRRDGGTAVRLYSREKTGEISETANISGGPSQGKKRQQA